MPAFETKAVQAATSRRTEPARLGPPIPLSVLIVDDLENEALLMELALTRYGYAPRCLRVDTREAMQTALTTQAWDLVIADYVMPHFDGLSALALVKELELDPPFIIVSGQITDATAVAAMKAGAHDYVMKDNLARLGSAVERELREARHRAERRRLEARLTAEHAVTRLLANAPGIEDTAPKLLEVLLEGLEADAAHFWVVEPGAGELELLAQRLREPSSPLRTFLESERHKSHSMGTGLAGRVWQERRALWISDLATENDLPAADAPRGVFAFPVETAGEFFGVLEFFTERPLPPDLSMMNTTVAIGSEVGQFISRCNAQEALQRAHDELEQRVRSRTADLASTNEKLQSVIQQRQRLEHELLEITDVERRRIGVDLHDDLGQRLTGLMLMTKGLERKLGNRQALETQDAARVHSLVEEALGHARKLAHGLATLDSQKMDLSAALGDFAARAQELFKIPCHFQATPELPSLDLNVKSQLCKIVQEAVTNAVKHGQPKEIKIALSHQPEGLLLTVKNDGKPFPDRAGSPNGMGLRIMSYRASLIGASLNIQSAKGQETCLSCFLPAAPNAGESQSAQAIRGQEPDAA